MRIKIGPLWYTIEMVKDLKNERGEGLFGEIRYTEQVIRLDEEMTPERTYAVLWHEIIHGIDDECGLALGEQGVATLATMIVQLLQDNPGLRYESRDEHPAGEEEHRGRTGAVQAALAQPGQENGHQGAG